VLPQSIQFHLQLGEATIDFVQVGILHGVLLFLQNLLINKDTGRAYDADSRPDSGGDQVGLQLTHLVQEKDQTAGVLKKHRHGVVFRLANGEESTICSRMTC